jgi:hypothetical protein
VPKEIAGVKRTRTIIIGAVTGYCSGWCYCGNEKAQHTKLKNIF